MFAHTSEDFAVTWSVVFDPNPAVRTSLNAVNRLSTNDFLGNLERQTVLYFALNRSTRHRFSCFVLVTPVSPAIETVVGIVVWVSDVAGLTVNPGRLR